MAKDRVVFVPWNQGQSGKFGTDGDWSNQQKDNTHHKRTWTTYFLDSAGTPLASLGFGVSARLHVFGHGVPPGQDNTKMYPDVQGAAPVAVSELADMLVAKGLKKHYMGTIVCDICYSALGTPPLAKQLAWAMYQRGYKCPVMGHKGAIFPVYFRYGAVQNNTYEHRIVEKLDGSLVKSKDAQTRFWGFTV
jgi:hypothetical protein